MRRFLSVAVLLLVALTSRAADPVINATLKPDSIAIGDHVILSVDIEKDMTQVIDLPHFEDNMLVQNIEILQEMPMDTVSVDGRHQKLTKQYVVTCFDAGIYTIDNFPVLYLDKNIVDTLKSQQALHLFVNTFPVDTTANTLYDIKKPIEAPFLASEVSGYIFWTSLFIIGMVALVYLLSNRKRKERKSVAPKLKELPHIVAIRELEQLNNQKVWQSNKHKLYYTRLTDIIREYLDGRYDIGAMEMTSDEIFDALRTITLEDRSRKELQSILRSADLVKFAKHIPSAEENEMAYNQAYYFVEQTKEIAEEIKPENNVEV